MNKTFKPANTPGSIDSPQHPLALHTNSRSDRFRLDVWGKNSPAPGELLVWVHPADEWAAPLDYSGWEVPIMVGLAEGCHVEIKREGGRSCPVRWDLWLKGDKELTGRSTLGGTVCDLLPDMIRFRTNQEHWDAPIRVTVSLRVPSDQPASPAPIIVPPLNS